MLLRLVSLLTLFFATFATSLVYAETHTMLVLDGSGSMWGQIEGKAKISIAREVVGDILQDWDEQDQLGLTVYGHRRKGDCSDIEEVIPVGKVNTEAFNKVVNDINPKGKTPMSDAVRIAAESLKYTEEAASVILVSDGKETCHADPCALAAELEKTGVEFTTHVIGFDVKDQQAITQLRCIADNTGGTFTSASSATELKNALNQAVKQSVSGTNLKVNVLLTEGGDRVGVNWIDVVDTTTGKKVERGIGGGARDSAQGFTVAPGEYKVVALADTVTAETLITVVEGQQHEVDVILNAGFVKVKTVAKPGGDPLAVEWIGLYQNDKRIKNNLGGSGSTIFLAPAGKLAVDAHKNPLQNGQSLDLVAGETVEVELVLNSGKLIANTKLASSGEKLGVNWFTAFKLDEAGNEKNVKRNLGNSGSTSMQLPVGKYRIQASHADGPMVSTEVEILAEQTTSVDIIFNHGWAMVSVEKDGQPVGQNWIQANAIKEDGSNGDLLIRKLGGSGKANILLPAGVTSRIIATPRQQAFSQLSKDLTVESGAKHEVIIDFPASGTVAVSSKLASSQEKLGVDWFTAFNIDQQGNEKQVSKVLGGSGQTNFILPVGKYRIQAQTRGGIRISNEVEIVDAQTITTELIFNYGWVNASFVKDGKNVGQNWIEAHEINADGSNGKRLTRTLGGSGKARMLLPAGKARVSGVPRQRGAEAPSKDVIVEAGQTADVIINVP